MRPMRNSGGSRGAAQTPLLDCEDPQDVALLLLVVHVVGVSILTVLLKLTYPQLWSNVANGKTTTLNGVLVLLSNASTNVQFVCLFVSFVSLLVVWIGQHLFDDDDDDYSRVPIYGYTIAAFNHNQRGRLGGAVKKCLDHAASLSLVLVIAMLLSNCTFSFRLLEIGNTLLSVTASIALLDTVLFQLHYTRIFYSLVLHVLHSAYFVIRTFIFFYQVSSHVFIECLFHMIPLFLLLAGVAVCLYTGLFLVLCMGPLMVFMGFLSAIILPGVIAIDLLGQMAIGLLVTQVNSGLWLNPPKYPSEPTADFVPGGSVALA